MFFRAASLRLFAETSRNTSGTYQSQIGAGLGMSDGHWLKARSFIFLIFKLTLNTHLRGTETRRISHGSWRSDAARGRADWRSGLDAQGGAPVHRQADRAGHDFADQAAIAIENVRLFESVEARTRELAKSLEDLRTAQDRLVQTEKLASLGQLTAGIAHEIKNPLNFVNNFSGLSTELIDELQEALMDVSLNEKRRSEITELMDTLRGNLAKVVQHGKRADAIVKNMLLHSRQGSQRAPAGRYQRHRRGEPQPRLSRGAGREAGLQYHAGKVLGPDCRRGRCVPAGDHAGAA